MDDSKHVNIDCNACGRKLWEVANVPCSVGVLNDKARSLAWLIVWTSADGGPFSERNVRHYCPSCRQGVRLP